MLRIWRKLDIEGLHSPSFYYEGFHIMTWSKHGNCHKFLMHFYHFLHKSVTHGGLLWRIYKCLEFQGIWISKTSMVRSVLQGLPGYDTRYFSLINS